METVWVAVGFVLFFAVLAYAGVPKMLTSALDARGKQVEAELGEARRLREEAQALLASFEQKRKDAEIEASSIIAQAKADAERMGREAEAKMADFVKRRTTQAEQKIAQAEAQATNEVRATAADAAVKASESILRTQVAGNAGEALVRTGLNEMKGRLN
ncbi:MAG: ATP F0F1 synthase subunit B [Beijerinckiaceae bacterium]